MNHLKSGASTVSVPPPEPQVRYSMRTLLIAMTAVAILAALLAPLLRTIPEDALQHVLIVWSTAAIACPCTYYFDRRSARKRLYRVKDKIGDDFRFQFMAMPSIYGDAHWRPVRMFLRFLLVITTALAYSLMPFVSDYSQVGPRSGVGLSLMFGYVVGAVAFAHLFGRPTNAIFLRNRGVNLDDREISWSYIRDAQWMPKRPNLLRLHRLDGDLMVNVPDAIRGEVEVFVKDRVAAAGRTAFESA